MNTFDPTHAGCIRHAVLLALGLFLASCDPGSPPAAGVDHESGAGTDPTADRLLAGKAAYEEVCASCHETGRGGAPRSDDPEAWSSRSTLWQAVLIEHARDGYIDMPARGGDDSITDPEVQAATEYMMSLAYPDRMPPD